MYRLSGISPSDPDNAEFSYGEYNVQLLAFQNHLTNNYFLLDAYLDPGMYVLTEGGPGTTVNVQLPAYPLQEIVISPEHGTNNAPVDQVDRAPQTDTLPQGWSLLGQGFRTTFYHVLAPLSAQPSGGIQTSVVGLSLQQSDMIVLKGNQADSGTLTVWSAGDELNPYVLVGDSFLEPVTASTPPANYVAEVDASTTQPQEEYWLRFQRSILDGNADVLVGFTVPMSGTPDLDVTDLHLEPDNGMTRVDITVENIGYADAGATSALYQFTDGTGHVIPSSSLPEAAVAARGEQTFSFTFQPDSVADKVQFTANSPPAFTEPNYVNNSQTVTLSQYDRAAPTVTLSLADPSMSYDPNIWGRYISGSDNGGPHSDILADVEDPVADPTGNLYQVWAYVPAYGENVGQGQLFIQNVSSPNGQLLISKDFQFSQLLPTNAKNNPNLFQVTAEDVYGLKSIEADRKVVVVARPSWLTGPGSTIAWDEPNRQYLIGFHKALIDYDKDVSQILLGDSAAPGAIPLIGSAQNEFLVRLDSDMVAGLNPGPTINGQVNGQLTLTVLGQSVLNETFQGSDQLTPNISIYVSLVLSGQDLSANILKVSFQFHDLNLLQYQTPAIPLFTYGIPGVLNLNLNIKFLINVMLNAGVSFGLPLNGPPDIDLLAPTYVSPSIMLGARLSGAAQVLGFDVASISGEVDFTLTVTIGLNTTDPGVGVPLTDFLSDPLSHLAVSVTGQVGVNFEADVLGLEVFSFSPTFAPFVIAGTPGIPITTFPTLAPAPVYDPATPVTGTSPMGTVTPDPRPNVVIDQTSGAGMYVQVVDATSNPSDLRGNLSFATMPVGGGPWSNPVILDQSENVTNPVLALTHDQAGSTTPGAPAVVVYQANSISNLTDFNSFLKAQDIRYRYWDGTAWQSEQALTSDTLFDSTPVVAFNSSGQGLTAWTRNGNEMPMTTALDRTKDEIAVAVWDPVHHVFLAPVQLTIPTPAGDSNTCPAVFAAADGTLYVTWICTDATGVTTPMVSYYSGGSWSQPQVLPTTGLPTGATLGSLAMGSDGAGRIDLLMTSTVSNPNTTTNPPDPNVPNPSPTVTTTLYNRVSSAANFLNSTPLETVTSGSNYSFLSTTNDNTGNLIAYWEQSDGQTNDVYAAVRSADGAWSDPAPLSNDHGLKYAPVPGGGRQRRLRDRLRDQTGSRYGHYCAWNFHTRDRVPATSGAGGPSDDHPHEQWRGYDPGQARARAGLFGTSELRGGARRARRHPGRGSGPDPQSRPGRHLGRHPVLRRHPRPGRRPRGRDATDLSRRRPYL